MFYCFRSIARLAKVTQEDLRAAAQKAPPALDHNAEWKLAKVILRFPQVSNYTYLTLQILHQSYAELSSFYRQNIYWNADMSCL